MHKVLSRLQDRSPRPVIYSGPKSKRRGHHEKPFEEDEILAVHHTYEANTCYTTLRFDMKWAIDKDLMFEGFSDKEGLDAFWATEFGEQNLQLPTETDSYGTRPVSNYSSGIFAVPGVYFTLSRDQNPNINAKGNYIVLGLNSLMRYVSSIVAKLREKGILQPDECSKLAGELLYWNPAWWHGIVGEMQDGRKTVRYTGDASDFIEHVQTQLANLDDTELESNELVVRVPLIVPCFNRVYISDDYDEGLKNTEKALPDWDTLKKNGLQLQNQSERA